MAHTALAFASFSSFFGWIGWDGRGAQV